MQARFYLITTIFFLSCGGAGIKKAALNCDASKGLKVKSDYSACECIKKDDGFERLTENGACIHSLSKLICESDSGALYSNSYNEGNLNPGLCSCKEGTKNNFSTCGTLNPNEATSADWKYYNVSKSSPEGFTFYKNNIFSIDSDFIICDSSFKNGSNNKNILLSCNNKDLSFNYYFKSEHTIKDIYFGVYKDDGKIKLKLAFLALKDNKIYLKYSVKDVDANKYFVEEKINLGDLISISNYEAKDTDTINIITPIDIEVIKNLDKNNFKVLVKTQDKYYSNVIDSGFSRDIVDIEKYFKFAFVSGSDYAYSFFYNNKINVFYNTDEKGIDSGYISSSFFYDTVQGEFKIIAFESSQNKIFTSKIDIISFETPLFDSITNLTDHKYFLKENNYLFVFNNSNILIIYKDENQNTIIDITEIEHGVFNKAAIKILDADKFLISFYNENKINTYLFEKEEDL